MALHMYKIIQAWSIHIEEMRRMVQDRLKLYEIFLKLDSMSLEKYSEQWSLSLKQQLASSKLVTYEKLLNSHDLASADEDGVSHWLLCLAYCKTEELTAIFIKFELDWFHVRYQGLTRGEKEKFLKENGFKFTPYNLIKVVLYMDRFEGCNRGYPLSHEWFEAPFEKVGELLATRTVVLESGRVYFTWDDIVHLVKVDLANRLNRRMGVIRKRTIEDERINDLLSSVRLITTGENSDHFTSSNRSVNAGNIDRIARKHFPLCMQYIHELVRKNHFLKYGCKMQYGVFLKSIGMPYEDALTFWRNEFVQKIPVEKYNKRYEYLFKHQYGKVGGRISHAPDSCDYIIRQDPLPTQHHGCPFKHWNWNKLRDRLGKSRGCSANSLTDIEDLVKKRHYRQACTRFFNRERNVAEGSIDSMQLVHSPMQYAATSMQGGELFNSDVKFDSEEEDLD